MKSWLRLHRYLGAFSAPMLILFAISGSWQLVNAHKSKKDGSYTAPAALHAVSDVHMGEDLEGPAKWAFRAVAWLVATSLVSDVDHRSDGGLPVRPLALDRSRGTRRSLAAGCALLARSRVARRPRAPAFSSRRRKLLLRSSPRRPAWRSARRRGGAPARAGRACRTGCRSGRARRGSGRSRRRGWSSRPSSARRRAPGRRRRPPGC